MQRTRLLGALFIVAMPYAVGAVLFGAHWLGGWMERNDLPLWYALAPVSALLPIVLAVAYLVFTKE